MTRFNCHRINKSLLFLIILFCVTCVMAGNPDQAPEAKRVRKAFKAHSSSKRKFIDVIIGTYLGNETNNYYGNDAPDKLDIIWKHFLGFGKTNSPKHGVTAYYGAGWTGQPLILKEKNIDYLVIGAYDHHLKKIKCETGELIWNYKYDDIIKGTGSVYINKHAESPEERYVILQGSRRGVENRHTDNTIESFRGISFLTGKEIWRLNVKRTPSYSRDVDGTALVFGDTVIIGLENGLLTLLDPVNIDLDSISGKCSPKILSEHNLYEQEDIFKHGGNLVTESTPCILKDRVYITAGSGHVYGYNLLKDSIDWDLYVRADMNGSPVVTDDSCLVVPIEKQYIKGQGGVMKVNPDKTPEESILWYFPTGDRRFADWSGGVIGSVAVDESKSQIAAFNAIDGYLYVVSHRDVTDSVKGPDNIQYYPKPKELFKYKIGPSISTPIIVNNRIIAAGYNGIYIFHYDKDFNFSLVNEYPGVFESTPVAYNKRIYIASRDGYLYCFGDTSTTGEVIDKEERKEIDAFETEPVEEMEPLIVEKIKVPEYKMEPVIKYLSYVKERLEMNKSVASGHGRILSYLCNNIKADPQKEQSDDISDKKYHLITGSFTIKENAIRFFEDLKAEGFEASMFGPRGGFYFVSLISFSTREKATDSLPIAYNKGYKDAWVMKY